MESTFSDLRKLSKCSEIMISIFYNGKNQLNVAGKKFINLDLLKPSGCSFRIFENQLNALREAATGGVL